MIASGKLRLCPMTLDLAKEYFRDFAFDSDVFMDGQEFKTFSYSDAYVEQTLQHNAQKKSGLSGNSG